MSRIAEKSQKALETAGLFEPQTRAARLRHALPGIEQALANGASIESCRNALKSVGLVFASASAFNVALHRARRSGRLAALDVKAQAGLGNKKHSMGAAVESEKTPEEESLGGRGAGEFTAGGVPIFRPKRVEYGTNRTPNMKDFV